MAVIQEDADFDKQLLVELLGRCVRRDEAAFARLYEQTSTRVYSLALVMTSNQADAEEVVGDVYSQVWRNAGAYQRGRGSVMTWLLVICRSRALDLLRKRRAADQGQERYGQYLDTQDGVDTLFYGELDEGYHVHASLAQLPQVQRQLLGLAFFRGLSHQEIADSTEMPLGTVKSHIRRGLMALKQLLQ